MPKINVYLPDDLAAAVRAAGIPVSPVCQRALADAVRAVSGIRAAIEMIRAADFDPAAHPEIGERLSSRITARLDEILGLARQLGGGQAGSADLLAALLDHGSNLGVLLLEAIDIAPDEVRGRLGQVADTASAEAGEFTHEAWR